MIIDKERVKPKMAEFIINQYWMRDKPAQFKDIKEKFQTAPYKLSDGSLVNYLDELIAEKKIRKWRNESRVCYGPSKLHLAVRFCIAVNIFCVVASVPALILYNIIVIPLVFFGLGVLFTCFFWRFFSKKEG